MLLRTPLSSNSLTIKKNTKINNMSLISGDESKIFAKGVIGNVRKAQEDSHGYKLGTPNGDLFVVCDGMGGHVGGAMASRIAVDSIIAYVDKEKYGTPTDALDGALQFANMQILGYANDHPEYKGMGTTACIVLIRDIDVWIAHVGDSRIYLYLGKEKQLHRIKDHSYVQTLVDAGQITDEEAEHHPNKNRIMKALGVKPELQPTFNFANAPILPKNGDIFLICSDGLSGMIPDSTIERVFGEDLPLQQKGDRLMELAMIGETIQPGGQDNCTVELIEIDNSVSKKRFFKSYNPARSATWDGNEEKTSVSRKKIFKIVGVVMMVLVLLGSVLWRLSPDYYNRAIERAKIDTTETRETLNHMKGEYNKILDRKPVLGEPVDVQEKFNDLAELFYTDSLIPAEGNHNKALKKLTDLQNKKNRSEKFFHKKKQQ